MDRIENNVSETAFVITRAKIEMEEANKYTQKARKVSSSRFKIPTNVIIIYFDLETVYSVPIV